MLHKSSIVAMTITFFSLYFLQLIIRINMRRKFKQKLPYKIVFAKIINNETSSQCSHYHARDCDETYPKVCTNVSWNQNGNFSRFWFKIHKNPEAALTNSQVCHGTLTMCFINEYDTYIYVCNVWRTVLTTSVIASEFSHRYTFAYLSLWLFIDIRISLVTKKKKKKFKSSSAISSAFTRGLSALCIEGL